MQIDNALTCRHCGKPFARRPGAGRKPVYCSVSCRVMAHKRRQLAKRGADRLDRSSHIVAAWLAECNL